MYKIEFGWYGAIGLRMYAYIPVEAGRARWVVVHTFVIENKLDVPSMGDPFFRFKYEVRIGDGQAPDLESPQLLYKYGTSMYIDGGDEGTVNVYSETSDSKALAATGSYTTLMGIYPKTNIVSGGGDAIPNKKIIIPKQISITADGFAELNFTKCTACRGNAFVYMPNVTANVNGITRKFKKLPTVGSTSTITLAEITVTTAAVTADQTGIITVTATNINYLRPGDYLIEDIPNNVVSTRISSITANGSNYDILLEVFQGDGAGNGIAQGTVLTFQPTFITTGSDDQFQYQMITGDTYSKLIFSKLWNTYIGKTLSNVSGVTAAQDTVNLLMYKQGDRYSLIYERKLDPTKIVANTETEPFPPADFFGSNTETFDCRLSQRNAIAASPNAVSGPISYIKYLNPIPTESTGQRCNWRMGFTPNKPEINNQGKLIGWRSPVDNQLLLNQSGTTFTNVVSLPESQYVALDYHQYNQSISYTGLEQGEDWFARIHPFSQDFRIGQPKGSYSGICSEIILQKNDATTVTVTENDTDPTTGLGSVQPSTANTYPRWTNFNLASDASLYLTSSDLYLQSTTNIYTGTKSPEGGQLAIRANNVFVKVVYLDTDGNGTLEECFIRFAGTEQSYKAEVPNENGDGSIEVTYYVIPIKLFKIDGTELSGVSLESAALESSGSPLVTDAAGGTFTVGFNSVTMKAWFSDPNRDGRYDSPNSYTSGSLSTGVFEFDAFPLYPFIEMYDNSVINGAEIHDINLLGDVSTYNPQWKVNQIDGVDTINYDAGTNAQTGEININGVGNITQTPGIADDLVPPSFTQVSRLSSSQIDRQSSSLLRPGSTMTTLYINDETKLFDLTDIFGFDRKVITPDIVNTEAMFVTGRSLDNSTVNITMNITYVEQL
jgi:hypothetical protein